ncbi:2Fe-2S ferredoxin [Clostridium sp. W14A]|uniref:2Fe-2S ferredoxin n=1 Tax=Caproicibacter sp. TaxID=2814884 RepID=UPI000827E17A|nr:2Fe-2S ferredoxin [Clostridium sp. W14A]
MNQPKHHIFVCTSSRINGTQKGFCCTKDSAAVARRFQEEIEERELEGEVTVTNTGCFGLCEKGPVVVVYPEGVWYGNVTPDDVETIMEQHIEGDEPVQSLMI